jgi:hypothetical protein
LAALSHSTFHSWKKEGLVKAIKVGRRMAFYDIRDLDAMIERLRERVER